MNQKSVRITSALTALSAIAAAVVAIVAVNSSGVLSAQSTTTTIDLLNVGMCVTTDDSVFKEKDCDDGDGDASFTVGGRDEIVERDTVYATYAHDPITASEQPRAILKNADLVKVTISDKGRDRRRSVLYPARMNNDDDAYDTLLDGSAGEPVVTKIKSLISASDFADNLTDEQNISAFTSKNITLYRPRNPSGDAVISDSGIATLNFKRTETEDFLPLSDDEENDVVIFFGFEVTETAGDLDINDVNSIAGAQAKKDNLKILGAGSAEALIADEDRSSGGGDTPPWLSVQANVPNGKDLVIVAVLYETSDAEIIQGGAVCETLVGGDDEDTAMDCKTNSEQNADEPNYTDSEIGNKQALIARVQGDNGQGTKNLYLKETDRFTGKYAGYVRITDADGDGPRNAAGARQSQNWGLEFDDAESEMPEGAAVVGAQNGPVTITYRDSQGATRTLAIAVDIQPPTITIATPLHDSSGDDRSPDFTGSFEDGGAGLADDTFKLYVDNITDGGDGVVGDRKPDIDPVLDIPTTNIAAPTTTIQLRRDYASSDSFATLFGVLDGRAGGSGSLYFTTTGAAPEASETDNDAKRKVVNADTYDDGDGQGTFDDDARVEGSATNGREIAVDFQAVVIDLAGNVGFSDADPAGPSFINDYGTKAADRKDIKFHNVLGFYSRHVINLDDKDPEFLQDHTITGYYGLDSDGDPVPHRRGIMLTFDNDVSEDNLTERTFEVELDDGSNAIVDDIRVNKELVFLRLVADLGSSETPKISIAAGQRVEDFAGNQLQAREVKAFEAKDGVPPVLTVSLSNGSGTGQGTESSSSLTRNTIVVSVSSDEEIQGAPFFSVLCSNFTYADTGTTTPRKDVDDYADARTGPITGPRPGPNYVTASRCGTGSTATALTASETQMNKRPGLNWEYTWRNLAGSNAVPEGELRVVVYAQDRSQYKLEPGASVQNTHNWGSITTKFTYDTSLKPLVKGSTVDSTAGELLPTPDQKVSENRPFIMLNFTGENTAVEIEKLQVNSVDVTSRVETTERNRFVYWPEGLNFGTHEVEVDARDAAGNTTTFRYEFDKVTRSPFVVRLLAGWNAISLPQQPVDGSLEAAFSDPKVDQVIGYLRANETDDPQWLLATRQDGIWTTNYGELTNIAAGQGYWVHATSFVNQSILLRSPERLSQDLPTALIGITTYGGWNFVGVVDQDGDQTQNDWGQTLKQGIDAQKGKQYLGEYVRAYTWDATRSRFESLDPDDDVKIGDGIWVYYGSGVAP